jgi:hypothetical protein
LGERDPWFDFPQELRQMLQTIGAEIYRQDRLRAVHAKPTRARLHLVKKKSA